MARGFYDFSGESANDVVTQLSKFGRVGAAWNGGWETASKVVDLSGTNVWKFENGGSGGGQHNVYVNDDATLGSSSGVFSGAVEIVIKFRLHALGVDPYAPLVYLRCQADGTGHAARCIAANSSGNARWQLSEMNTSGSISDRIGGSSDTNTTLGALVADTDWFIRYQITGSDVHKMRPWPASGAEPETWLITSSADTTWTEGYIAFGNYDYLSKATVYFVGVATGADITDVGAGAPTEAIGASGVEPIVMKWRM